MLLREQMKAIQRELGGDDEEDELAELRARLELARVAQVVHLHQLARRDPIALRDAVDGLAALHHVDDPDQVGFDVRFGAGEREGRGLVRAGGTVSAGQERERRGRGRSPR